MRRSGMAGEVGGEMFRNGRDDLCGMTIEISNYGLDGKQ